MTTTPEPRDTEQECTAWQAILENTYANEALTPVIVVDGYGVSLRVENGQLIIKDGVGTHLRTRVIPRANRTVKRIVILGRAGALTLAALRWCTDVGISLSIVDPDGTLTAMTTSPNPNDARLRRTQATALGTSLGTGIARQLIVWKLEGQATLLHSLNCSEEAEQVRDLADQLQSADTITIERLREIEAAAAITYFAVWSQHAIAHFATRERSKVPTHWLTPLPRKSPLTRARSARRAADPVNAILNYAYTLGEAAIRQACLTVGLDPALGVMHADKHHRDSLTLDLLEPLRPIIDRDVLNLLALRRFRRLDFIETADGQIRLTETLTHELASAMPGWAGATAPTVEWLAHTLAETSPSKITKRTPLTQQRHLDARSSANPSRGVKPPRPIRSAATCRTCGIGLSGTQKVLCTACWTETRKDLATLRAQRGRESRLLITNSTGHDPAQTATARERRSESLRRERAARATWDKQNPVGTFDSETFAREIRPRLSAIPLSSIVKSTGVSISAASKIRNGLLSPHPRHWRSLIDLVAQVPGSP